MATKESLAQVIAGLLQACNIHCSVNVADYGYMVLLGERLPQEEWRQLIQLARIVERLTGEPIWLIPSPPARAPVQQGRGRK